MEGSKVNDVRRCNPGSPMQRTSSITPTSQTMNQPTNKTQKHNLHMRRASTDKVLGEHDAKAISCMGSTVKKCVTSNDGAIATKASPNTDHISKIFPIKKEQAQAIHAEFIENLETAKKKIKTYHDDLQPKIKEYEKQLEEVMTNYNLSDQAKEDLRNKFHSYFNSSINADELDAIYKENSINQSQQTQIDTIITKAQILLPNAGISSTQDYQDEILECDMIKTKLNMFCNNMIGGVQDLTPEIIKSNPIDAIQRIIQSCEKYDNTYVDQPALEFVEKFSLKMVFNARFDTSESNPHKELTDKVHEGNMFLGYEYSAIETLIAKIISSTTNIDTETITANIEQYKKNLSGQKLGAAQYGTTGGLRGRIDLRKTNNPSTQLPPFPQGDSLEFVTNQSFALTSDQKGYKPDDYKQLSQKATGLNEQQYGNLFNPNITRTEKSRYRTCATAESVPPYLMDIINNPKLVREGMDNDQIDSFKQQLLNNLDHTTTKDYKIFKSCIDTSSAQWTAKPSFAASMINNGIRTVCSCSGTTTVIAGQLLKHMELAKENRDGILNSLYNLSKSSESDTKPTLDTNLVKLISSISLCMQLQQAHSAGEVIAAFYQMACCIQVQQPGIDDMLKGFDKIMKLFAKYPEAFLQIPDEKTHDI